MKFSEKLYKILDEKNQDRGWQSAFAHRAGISQNALSKIISRNTKSPGIEIISAIVDALDGEIFSTPHTTIRRVEEHAPAEIVAGDNLKTIQVYASAGAGPGIALSELEPLFSVTAPPAYFYRCDFAVHVDGHSMEPTIPHHAVVGVLKIEEFRANELYVACIPYEGLVVKRIAVDRESGEFVFKSDNLDKSAYPDYRESIEASENIIQGRVVWIMRGY